MPFFQSSLNSRIKGAHISLLDSNQIHTEYLFGVQQWPYYRDFAIESGIKISQFII